jgi:hypothetical protein
LVIGGDGSACRSIDGGETWEEHSVGEDVSSHAVFDGTSFVVWGRGVRHASDDGISWSPTATSPESLDLGPVVAEASGRLSGVRGSWDTWYEDQVFYYSEDGVSWSESESYVGSHPIRAMAAGEVTAFEGCEN